MSSSFSDSGKSGGARRLSWALLALVFSLLIPAQVSPNDDEKNIENFAVKRVQPAYPPLAQKYRIEGTVVVQVSVTGDGKVTKAEFIRGHNIFRSVSLDAAKRWEFKSPGEGGLQGTVRFVFKLNN